MMTGKKANGSDTKEMEQLEKSAQETVDASAQKTSSRTVPEKNEAERQLKESAADIRIRAQDYQRQYGTDSVF